MKKQTIPTIALFAVFQMVSLLVVYAMLRGGIEESRNAFFKTLVFGLFVFLAPTLFFKQSDSRGMGSLLLFLFAGFLGWLKLRWGIPAQTFIYVAAILTLVVAVRKPAAVNLPTVPTFGIWIVFNTWVAGIVWGNPFFNSATFLELMPYQTVGGDYLGILSGMNLFKTYGISTIGIDGIIPIQYHIANRWLMLHHASLFDLTVGEGYQLLFPTVTVPFFFLQFLYAVQTLFRRADQTFTPLFWMLLLIGFVNVIPVAILTSWIPPSYGWNRILTSDSYTLGAAILFAAMSWTLANREKPIIYFILPWFVGLAFFAKISSAFTLLVALTYLFWRERRYKVTAGKLSVVLTLLVVVTVTQFTVTQMPLELRPFDFLRAWVKPQWRVFFFLSHYFLAAVFVFLKLGALGVRNAVSLRRAIAERRTISIELLLVICLAGSLPGIFLRIPDGNAVFFSCDQEWLALALLLALTPTVFKWRPAPAVGLGLIFIASLSNVRDVTAVLHTQNLALRSWRRENPRPHDARSKVLAKLVELGNLPINEKRKQLLYIPMTNEPFWNLTTCENVHYAATAITGIALLDGMPLTDCKVNPFTNGLNYYPPRMASPEPLAKTSLCRLTRSRGFSSVIYLDWQENEQRVQTFDCTRSFF